MRIVLGGRTPIWCITFSDGCPGMKARSMASAGHVHLAPGICKLVVALPAYKSQLRG